jgi:RPA family protein
MVERMTAKKVRILDLVRGKYFYGSKEEMKPSYVITPFGEKISRVNLIGTVTEKFIGEEGNYSSITIDDGTESIRIKSFEETPFDKIKLGDVVRVIGKVKEYNTELYVAHETVGKIDDINFELLHRAETLGSMVKQKKIVDDIRILADQVDETELRAYAKGTYSLDDETLAAIIDSKKKEVDYRPAVMEMIEKLDEGKGVEVKKLFEVLSLPDNTVEKTLNQLINEGSVYEPTIGFLRKV